MKKYSIIISGHRTSISIEPEFLDALRDLAKKQNRTLGGLIEEIDTARAGQGGLSGAIRLYVLNALQKQCQQNNPQ